MTKGFTFTGTLLVLSRAILIHVIVVWSFLLSSKKFGWWNLFSICWGLIITFILSLLLLLLHYWTLALVSLTRMARWISAAFRIRGCSLSRTNLFILIKRAALSKVRWRGFLFGQSFVLDGFLRYYELLIRSNVVIHCLSFAYQWRHLPWQRSLDISSVFIHTTWGDKRWLWEFERSRLNLFGLSRTITEQLMFGFCGWCLSIYSLIFLRRNLVLL